MPGLENRVENHRRQAFVQPLVVVTLLRAWGPVGGPSLSELYCMVCVLRGVWRDSHGASGALSLSVEEGKSIFGIMVGLWAKF